jgi:hypothetical protein
MSAHRAPKRWRNFPFLFEFPLLENRKARRGEQEPQISKKGKGWKRKMPFPCGPFESCLNGANAASHFFFSSKQHLPCSLPEEQMRSHLGLVLGLADFFFFRSGSVGPTGSDPFLYSYGEPCHTASMLNSLDGPARRSARVLIRSLARPPGGSSWALRSFLVFVQCLCASVCDAGRDGNLASPPCRWPSSGMGPTRLVGSATRSPVHLKPRRRKRAANLGWVRMGVPGSPKGSLFSLTLIQFHALHSRILLRRCPDGPLRAHPVGLASSGYMLLMRVSHALTPLHLHPPS